MNNTVTILCSGFGLGFYVPGLLIERKLHALGIKAETEVFESLMADDKRRMTDNSRKAYQQNFSVALGSQKIPGDIRNSLDLAEVQSLFERWRSEGRQHFIALSGHWVHILDLFREAADYPVYADLLYVDSDLSPSWKNLRKLNPGYAEPYREVSMYDRENKNVLWRLDVEGLMPLPYTARNGRLVVHGGGWGIGTFRQKIDEMEAAGYELDISAYSVDEIGEDTGGRRYYMIDPEWRTWLRDSGGTHTFPRFGRVSRSEQHFQACAEYGQGLYGIIRQSAAIISKPGGGTLLDSLSSATPLVLLEPFGPHEKINSDIWESLGFGIRYDRWRDSGFAAEPLQQLARNLMQARERYPDYIASYAERLYAMEGRE
ncbi:UDP-glucuronosyltransferase [Paenibacillus oralis]|uniref:UDP-glucuronosyltransferase n=1 Tax=Paenibacillus oralis TaxID=2490856 RepID=A0A3P3U9L7_9BACL|nr:UDP-glucuronosyltransferase [Paenibacillus oralis]RRJ66990.1 UDP-glucuronosyltransferase [Paenibacillus oralis]